MSQTPKVAVTGFRAVCGANIEWDSTGASTLRGSFANDGHRNDGHRAAQKTRALCAQPPTLDARAETAPAAARRAVVFSSSKSRWMRQTGAFDGCHTETARRIARAVRAEGALLAPVAACATGAHAIALAAQLITDGYADYAVAGAEEIGLPPLIRAAYRRLGALSRSGIMRPFDHRRDGFVPAEGWGWLTLENAAMARARGATIHGYVAGWSQHGDPHSMTAMTPDGSAIACAIEGAVHMAGAPTLDYINAHGTATALNDVAETRGIRSALGVSTPVSATKPLTGHLLGAAGVVEAIICLLAMRESYAPPTWNLEEADVECNLDCIPQQGRALKINHALSLNYGFGGHIGVLLLKAEHTPADAAE